MERNLIEYSHEAREKSIRKEILLCTVILILSIAAAYVFLGGPRLLGFFAAGEQKVFSDTINKEFNESQDYVWQLQNVPAGEFQLNSVKLSGSISGNAKVYLVTDSGKLLIFDSSSLKTGLSPLTAFAAAEAPQQTGASAEPGPPSSGDSSSPEESPSKETDTTSGPGAESPANETPPAEIPPKNITLPEENITVLENVTENQTQENITLPENATNQTQEIPLAVEIPFETACEETCYISEILNKSNYTLQIEVEPGTILKLGSITYELFISKENLTNITNETVFFATDIKDSGNNTIAATIEFVNTTNDQVEAIGQSEEAPAKTAAAAPAPLFQAAAVAEEPAGAPGLDIPKGKYNIKVKPQNMPIQEIVFNDIDITQNITEFIKLDDVPENVTNLSNVVEIYAIDPTAFTFSTAIVTAISPGNSLHKCKNWDFDNQNCTDGNWTFMQAITPGGIYSFTLTPEDPAYLITIQDLGVTNDSYVDQANSGTNYGTATTVYVQSRYSSRNMRTFEMFNVSNISSQATIVSANLSLYKTGGTGSSTRTYNLYRVTASWTESGITWTNQPAVSGTLTSSASVATGTNNVWKTWDVTSDVQNFVNGSYANYGWRISDSSESSVTQYASNFASEEYTTNTSLRPRLDIYYTVPPTTPTNITCNSGSCNNTFYNNVTLQCSGSTAGNETITYVIDANYSAASTSESSTDVPTSCSDTTYSNGQTYEFYSKWTIPGSGNVTLTKLRFYDVDGSISSSENIQIALYADGGSYSRLSPIVTITGTGAVGWLNGTLSSPINITLGQTYWIGVGPSGSPTYNLARDDSANCASYPPTGTGSYYPSASGGLDASVPTGASQSANKYTIPGIVYTTTSDVKTWRTVGNHTNGSTYLWNLSGIAEQSNIDLRCRAIDLAGGNTYSNYSTGTYNLTITGTPPPDTTPPAAVTGLNETSTGTSWIYWAWTNPTDPDFSQAIIYIDGSNILNTSNAYYNATGFSCNTTHNITIRTKDTTGNVNTTNVTDSATTSACPDALAPTYSNDSDNSSGSVTNNKIVAVSTYWQDNIQLSTATFRNNASGSWVNVSTCALSGASSWCNTTINASSYAGKTICWNQYANDTTGNLNATMSQTAHCFNVTQYNTAPATTTPTIDPAVAYKTSTLYCNATLTDAEQTSLTAYWIWYKNGVTNLTGTKTNITNGTNTNITTLTSGNLTKSDIWICGITPNDGIVNGTAANSTGKTIQNSPPTIPSSLAPTTGTYGGTNNTIPVNCSGSTDADGDTITYNIDAYYNSVWSTINSGTGIYNWNISALSSQTNVALRCNATDSTNTTTYYAPSANITIDNTLPTSTANSPANNSVDGDGSVLFNCSATDNNALASISLYINSILNQTNTVTGTSNSTTFSKTLANSNYNWYCRATDAVGNANNSVTYYLTVNTAAVPISTHYSGNTTSWAALPDLTNICNGQAILEIPSYGKIQWYGCVNAASQNFDTNVNISNNFIAVNFGLNPTFNSSAHVIMRGLTWDSTPEILMDGVFCDSSVCQNITYDNVSTLEFDVTHFTNFSTVGNARLVIWDQNDTGMPGDNLSACLSSQIKFFANYTRSLNGNPITGATCIINFTDTTNNAMTYNATSTFYEYNRTFSTIGLKTYIISCVKTTLPTRQRITLSDAVNITDCAPPQWSSNQSSYPAKYNASQLSSFNITWADNANVSAVLIEGNWSGSPQNYSMNLISGTAANGVWNYSTGPLAAGTYYWKSYANDTSNSWNSTSTWTFVIAKADNPTDLYLNGNKNQNVTITYPAQSNATGTALVGAASLLRDGGSVSNPEIANLTAKPAGYNYTVTTVGNANYSANSTTYYLFVNKQPTAVDLYINGNLNQNVTINYGTPSNVTAVGYNGTVTLYENGSNLGNPRTATLGASTYNYTAFILDDANHTGSSKTFFLTVSPVASQVQLLLDGASANKTVEVGSTVNLTATLITPSTGIVQLYRAGSQIQSGNAPITNLSTFSTLGAFNITEIYPATQNYSSSSQTYYVITQDTTPPSVYTTSPGNNTAIASHTQSFVFNATDNYYTTLNCTLYINNIPSGTNASVAVNTQTTITNTTIPEGNDPWYVNCTDSSSNTGKSETRVLTVDVTPPVITHIRPVQNDIVGYNVTLDIDVTDNLVGVASAWYEIRNSSGIVKSGTLPGPAYQDVWNSKTVQDGNYTFRAYANDTVGNQGNSSVNFTVDNTAPFIQILRPLNGSRWNSNFNLNVTIQNTRINASTYNITNSTGYVVQSNSNNSINSNYFAWTDLVNVTSLPSGTYVINAYAKDSIGYETTENSTFIIDKAPPQYSNLVASPASPTIYSPTQAYQFNATWTDNLAVGAVIFEFNGTNYTDATSVGSVFSKNFTGLSVGTYNYKWYANDTTGNWNSTGTFTYTINKAPTTTSLYLNGAQANKTIIYGAQSNATAITSAGVVTLYRNGTNVGTQEIATLGAGIYNYTAINTGDSNYLPSSETWFLTVGMQATAVDLYLNGTQANLTVTYPTQTNVTAIGYNGTATLYKNGSIISSPEIATLAAGIYNYTAAISGDVNHTGSSKTFFITVGKQPTAVDLFLNGTQNNLTITYGTQSNVTAAGYNGSVTLYRNGTNVGTSEIAILAAGTYNYTAAIPDDTNRTGSSKTFFLTVNKATPTLNLLLDGIAADKNVTYPTQTNATGYETNTGDSDITYTLYRNSNTIGSGSTVSDIATLGVSTYIYTYNTTGGVNYTSNTVNRTLIVNIQPTAVNLFLNGNQSNLTIIYGTQSNATAVGYNGTVTLYRNGTPVGNPEITVLPYGLYNYTAVIPDTVNKTGSSKTYFLNVGKQGTEAQLYLNGNRNNLTITYGTQSNATAVFINKTGTLYKNGAPIASPDIGIFAAGTYNYSAVIDSDVNKTGSSENWTLTVNKAAANITLLLNGTNNDFSVNRSQTVNITGVRTTGDGNMQLYDNGILINSGAPVITNTTSYATLGQRNITLYLPETQNYSAATSTHFLSVYGILSAYVTAPTGTPKYYEGQNITFKGYVRDELANPIDGTTVTFEPINGSYVYVCSSTLGEGSGVYNCTLDTTGMASPKTYDVRINATKTYYHIGTYKNASIFFLESGQKANLLLHKIPSVQAINSSYITYNVSLHLANGRGTSDNTTLTDPDAGQNWSIGSIYGAQEIIENYLLTYARGAADNTITLQKANVTGYDPFYNMSLFTESNQPTIVIPQNITGAQLTLIKNLVFVNQTTTNITYTIVDTVVNSGGEDLTGISVVDSDTSLITFVNLTRGNSITYSGNVTVQKNAQSSTSNFVKTVAIIGGQNYSSNLPVIIIPGYGGPYDVIIDSLPSSVTAGSTITGIVKAINMNSEISEDRTLTTWIADSFGNITALDVRTIFIGRNQSATATITLTAPSTPGTYTFVSELAWPTATANASKAFDVTSAVVPVPVPAAGPAVAPPVNITLPPGVPQDIINSLIELRNTYNTLNREVQDFNTMIQMAEDAAAKGNYDEARNLINTAYGELAEIQLQMCGKIVCGNITAPKIGITLPTVQFTWPKLPEINIAKFFGTKWLIWTLLAVATAIFIIAFIVWRSEEMALEAELLREERTHLEKLYGKVSDYLGRKKKQGDKKNEI